VIDHKAFATREAFEAARSTYLRSMDVEIIALAGFMRVLTAGFIAGWEGRMINIHPSLLPAYKGLHTHERALADGAMPVHGCSVHLVATAELDGGPVLLSRPRCRCCPGDTPESRCASEPTRVLPSSQEHIIYPARRWPFSPVSCAARAFTAPCHPAQSREDTEVEMTKPLPIIIDTDPGQDDAVAILLALASPEFEVLGITAVAGNVPLALTEVNARKICELAGRPDMKVHSGAIRPMVRKLVTAEEVHGKTGLDGPVLPDPQMPLQRQHAVDFIVETLMSRPAGTVTLCTLGPLTNIGLALVREPKHRHPRQADRRHGRGLFRAGQRDALRRVQHLCRSACGAPRARVRHSHHADPAGLHASGAHHAEARGSLQEDAKRSQAPPPPRCSISSSASMKTNTAPTAARCMTHASSPGC
jgi:hypothetical protein